MLVLIVKGHQADGTLKAVIGAAYEALREVPARLDLQVAKGLALVAEALLVRDELDPGSWATLTSTVAGVIDLPAQDLSRARAAVALAESRRSALTADPVRLFREAAANAEVQRTAQAGKMPADS